MSARSRRIPIRRQALQAYQGVLSTNAACEAGPTHHCHSERSRREPCTLRLRRARIQEDALSFRAKSRNLLFLSPHHRIHTAPGTPCELPPPQILILIPKIIPRIPHDRFLTRRLQLSPELP